MSAATENLPVAFAALLAGGLLLEHGTSTVKTAFGGGSGTGAGSAPVAGNAKSIRDYLVSQGLTKTAAAGIVGNLQQESGLDPSAAGGGLAQWQAPRGPSSWDLSSQLSYLVSDLKGPYNGLFQQLNAAASPGDAAVLFQNQYERPGIPMQQNRVRYANAAYRL